MESHILNEIDENCVTSFELDEAYYLLNEALATSNDQSGFWKLCQSAVAEFEAAVIAENEQNASPGQINCESESKVNNESVESVEPAEEDLFNVNENDLNQAVADYMQYVLADDETETYNDFENGIQISFDLNSSNVEIPANDSVESRLNDTMEAVEVSHGSRAAESEIDENEEDSDADTEEYSSDDESYESESSGYISDDSYELFESFEGSSFYSDDELW